MPVEEVHRRKLVYPCNHDPQGNPRPNSYLLERGIVVRNRSSEPMLDNTIRITIGSDGEMERLKEALSGWEG